MTMLRHALLISNFRLADGIYDMELVEPALAASAVPGQFVMVAINESIEPFLRRPFSIAGIDRDQGIIRLIYQTVGKGTAQMAGWEPGRKVDLLGPLGNGFSWEEGLIGAILVGGGIGIAPLLPLANELRASGKDALVFIGAASASRIIGADLFDSYGCRVWLATEDGSAGIKGFVTLPLEEHLQQQFQSSKQQYQSPGQPLQPPANTALLPLGQSLQPSADAALQPLGQPLPPSADATLPPWQLFACGPALFLKTVAALCSRYTLCAQLSMEEKMGCGIGACMGCSIPVKSSAGEVRQKRVCYDGPVFDAREVYYG
ncbi:MAG: dihydroorotate dehydrogenase electron transfer subunit [Peptococcaceae bacterium]|jgi:dihydroorotate dehydrogenase electron transfer subunit|nr:dihydroorotate dehydrogenase electron transfer subunit [Peptococcaceae bacterium]